MQQLPSPSPLWGITPSEEPSLGCQPDFLELKFFDLDPLHALKRSFPHSISISSTIWPLTSHEAPERRERQESLLESCESFSALACVLNLTSLFLNQPIARTRVHEFLQRWKKNSSCPVYFDCGQNPLPPWIPAVQCVSDPLWFEESVNGPYWKIHGWHETRWIRLYSPSSLLKLAQLAEQHSPQCVVLAHSQRTKQLAEIKSILKVQKSP